MSYGQFISWTFHIASKEGSSLTPKNGSPLALKGDLFSTEGWLKTCSKIIIIEITFWQIHYKMFLLGSGQYKSVSD